VREVASRHGRTPRVQLRGEPRDGFVFYPRETVLGPLVQRLSADLMTLVRFVGHADERSARSRARPWSQGGPETIKTNPSRTTSSPPSAQPQRMQAHTRQKLPVGPLHRGRRANRRPLSGFGSERELTEILRRWARVQLGDAHTWVLLPELLTENRIPDLVLARIDIPELTTRIVDGAHRGLGTTELMIMRTLRQDRTLSLNSMAKRIFVSPDHARRVLRVLSAEGYVEEVRPRQFRRIRAFRPIVSRFVAFEAKLNDWRSALFQARMHQSFADEAYVAFDAHFRGRFEAARPTYAQIGVGLKAVDATTKTCVNVEPSRRGLRIPLSVAFVSERVLDRLVGNPVRQLPETRLPNGVWTFEGPRRLELVGPGSRNVLQLLGGHGDVEERFFQAG
jgi:hypothetical protein